MAHNNEHNRFSVDPNLLYLAPAHPGLPPPPGAPFENLHPPVPMGPPAVLVENVAEALQPIREELGRVAAIVASMAETTRETSKLTHELCDRTRSLELAVKKLDPNAETDADDEKSDDEDTQRPKKRPRSSKGGGPTKGQRSTMFTIVRKSLYNGCDVEEMKEFKAGLTGDELARRITDDPALPWLPNFKLSLKHEDNDFWVNKKIIPTALNHPDSKEPLAKGDIPKEFWTHDYLRDYILKGIWESARKAVQVNADPKKKEETQSKQREANMKSRKDRLFQARYDLAIGDEEHPPFRVVVREQSRAIPPKLLVREVMSDVSDEVFGFRQIPSGITLEAYKEGRNAFKYEGVTPFYRHKMWNTVFGDMDKVLRDRKATIQPRYYASATNRGQRTEDPEKVSDIPVRVLYRCHIDKVWYNRLSEPMKKLVKPSPSGWEVDEELVPEGAEAD